MVVRHKNLYPTEQCISNSREKLLALDTGGWRTERPVMDVAKCNYCGLCAIYCPPQCMRDKGDHYEADLTWCKGCGICAHECPRQAIIMVPEGESNGAG
jgi:pyruvate ferredoxin oxidoreductase delta subunit